LVIPAVRVVYDYSWFVGFAVAFVAYYVLMRLKEPAVPAREETS
jgi:cytosine/uracil/thiamine/allantoin permease